MPKVCPKCGNDDANTLFVWCEVTKEKVRYSHSYCELCSFEFYDECDKEWAEKENGE